jgi:hypothetical protein
MRRPQVITVLCWFSKLSRIPPFAGGGTLPDNCDVQRRSPGKRWASVSIRRRQVAIHLRRRQVAIRLQRRQVAIHLRHRQVTIRLCHRQACRQRARQSRQSGRVRATAAMHRQLGLQQTADRAVVTTGPRGSCGWWRTTLSSSLTGWTTPRHRAGRETLMVRGALPAIEVPLGALIAVEA